MIFRLLILAACCAAGLASAAGWLPVNPPPAGSSYLVEPAGPARFYRLRKP